MLDDFRKQADDSLFEFEEVEEEEEPQEQPEGVMRLLSVGPVWGITPRQRFILAMMLFLFICLLGALFLLLTQRVALPSLG
ncbi:MAG: hypothetical protein AB1894_00470 [Chloroflexota bacterium]